MTGGRVRAEIGGPSSVGEAEVFRNLDRESREEPRTTSFYRSRFKSRIAIGQNSAKNTFLGRPQKSRLFFYAPKKPKKSAVTPKKCRRASMNSGGSADGLSACTPFGWS